MLRLPRQRSHTRTGVTATATQPTCPTPASSSLLRGRSAPARFDASHHAHLALHIRRAHHACGVALATASATRTPEPRRPARVPFCGRSFASFLVLVFPFVGLFARDTRGCAACTCTLSCLRPHFRAPLFVSAGWLPFAQPDARALFGITRFVLLLPLPDQTLVVPPHTTRIIRIISTCKSNSSHHPHPFPPALLAHCFCVLPPVPRRSPSFDTGLVRPPRSSPCVGSPSSFLRSFRPRESEVGPHVSGGPGSGSNRKSADNGGEGGGRAACRVLHLLRRTVFGAGGHACEAERQTGMLIVPALPEPFASLHVFDTLHNNRPAATTSTSSASRTCVLLSQGATAWKWRLKKTRRGS